jgi:hypothetical protein
MARHNDGAAFSAASNRCWQTEIQFALLLQWSVAFHTVVSEQWADVAIEIRYLRPGRKTAHRMQSQKN